MAIEAQEGSTLDIRLFLRNCLFFGIARSSQFGNLVTASNTGLWEDLTFGIYFQVYHLNNLEKEYVLQK